MLCWACVSAVKKSRWAMLGAIYDLGHRCLALLELTDGHEWERNISLRFLTSAERRNVEQVLSKMVAKDDGVRPRYEPGWLWVVEGGVNSRCTAQWR